jgi:hypothetical protein
VLLGAGIGAAALGSSRRTDGLNRRRVGQIAA